VDLLSGTFLDAPDAQFAVGNAVIPPSQTLEDGQLNLPSGGQRDYFVLLASMEEART
jgi:hypothetical protein